MIDVVVGIVIERMGDEAMRAAVLDAAQRRVREEIDWIRMSLVGDAIRG